MKELSKSKEENIKKNNQEHLISNLKNLESPKKDFFISQLEKNDFDLMSFLFNLHKQEEKEKKYLSKLISPIQSQYSYSDIEKEKEKFLKKGFEAIFQGKIGYLILAGGLGTRLGFDHPKGMYNINMPSNKSLFEYLCNRFLSSQIRAKEFFKNNKNNENNNNDLNFIFKESTLFVMTSEHNNIETQEFFKKNDYFHLNPNNIIFFPQNEICALDLDGKVILNSPEELYQAPDGNGGCFTAIKTNKIIEICEERGIEFLNVTSIDNPLYKVLDPIFIGVTLLLGKKGNEQMSAKYKKKVDPEEKTGNFLNYDGHPMMLDYMEMPDEIKSLRIDNNNNNNSDLVYKASNILDYLISVKFLKKVLLDENMFKKLIKEFHILKKKFNACYLKNNSNEYEYKNNITGLKFEIFFNSIFEFAENEGLLLFEVEEENEFAPVKNNNNEKTNNPNLTRIKISNLCKKWYKKSGGIIENDDDNKILEISFLLCYDWDDVFNKNNNIPKKIDFKNVGAIYFKNDEIEK
jgi:UDP-N-acetylglucosamine/UDP-N-acetylgalactosamine diphosphorylase